MYGITQGVNAGSRQGLGSGRPRIDPFKMDFDMQQAGPVSRSVRLNGFATCLRLEAVYWRILERIAQANRCSVSAVLSYVDREVHLRHGGVRNFSGLIRVICVAWLQDAPDSH
ncbi:ribbon-helix-helix domain-containing protein [Pseudomonas sichuanensis]|uniref:ribbon-helix-helix domain-containing protein n=1 Tax=Pseudomonas sichuanensis TaxID=2213015 RepID=UPI00244CF10E|nr:ribbon-helix-helix domain-containing protein [Pseudomonas sichuanensis]MDH0729661.1 ribbon-helix-helix domain-containing protein [Pseudomonas sichuanensis]MDH1582182.1 ribbon-helix-helix domain-containing protein [Pseudomonas sichuanensis]MDH1591287.1 ribbon-helix-helix domain-containing protein [Pseudomonas sichuanensis]MDH1596889.1 ribbon-helix-helix domain-containing protein [Pseudomonas sichuanensis]